MIMTAAQSSSERVCAAKWPESMFPSEFALIDEVLPALAAHSVGGIFAGSRIQLLL